MKLYSFFSNKCSIVAVLFLMTAQPAFAERKLVMMGGGGEPEGDTTIFDDTLTKLGQYVEKSNWGEVSLSFNGGHGTTESILQNQFNTNKMSSFTTETWKRTIENYEAQLKSGQLKAGDQLLVMIDSHGGLSRDYQNETTHPIATGLIRSALDLNNLNGSTEVSMDDLKNLTALAKEKGIKLGIIDLSCHSGNSLALANENTCVISASGQKHFAYTDFAENFMANMKDGKSLEDVFLETRRSSSSKAYPMISTSEGESIKRELYEGLTPYLYDLHKVFETSSKLSTYLLDASADVNGCVRQNEYEKLHKKISDLEKSSNLNIKKIMPEITSIKENLQTYKEKQDQYLAFLKSLKPKEFEIREKLTGKATVAKKTSSVSADYSWQELLETDFDSLIKNLYSSLNHSTSSTNAKSMPELEVRTLVDLYIKANIKKRSIIANNPDLNNSNYKTKFEEQLNLQKDVFMLSDRIGREEKQIYDVMYRNFRQENNQKNPCRDFLL